MARHNPSIIGPWPALLTPRAGLIGMLLVVLALVMTACPKAAKPGSSAVRIDIERYHVPLFGSDSEYALGGTAPLATVVMFSNYACPPCGRSWKILRNLVEDYGQDLRVVYRHVPISGYQPGDLAAEAAFAAGAQDKFWEFHWRLIEHGHDGLARPLFLAHAGRLGLDVERFVADLDGGAHSAKLARHRRQAVALGVAAGPVLFVNGLLLMGGRDDEAAWHALLDEEIRRARVLLQDGTPRTRLYEEFMKGAAKRPIQEDDAASKLRAQPEKPGAKSKKTFRTPDAQKRYRVLPGDAPTLGPVGAPVVVVEFVDFQCPFCRRAWAEVMVKIREAYPDDVRIAVRHMPLEIHPAAMGAAVASVAAHRQGKFWPFHDRLFVTKEPVGQRLFVDIAKELGLDVKKFKRDNEDPKLRELVERDIAFANRVGVSGTPGSFVNGRYIGGLKSFALFAAIIDEELEEAQRRQEQGTPRATFFNAIMEEARSETEFPNATR